MAKIKIKRHPKFETLYERPPDTELIILIGGRGGMKTYECSKFGAYEATIKQRRVAVLRDEKETIRESILNEIFMRYDTANKYGHFEGHFEKIGNGIRNLKTGAMQVFTKGFRASSNEKRTNLKGVSDTDTAIVEEAEDIRSFEKFNTFRDSIRTRDRLIIVLLNTPDIQHWIVKRYFNLEAVESVELPNGQVIKIDGYWKLVPKKIPGFHCIQTSYLDNPYLPDGVVRDYTNYGNPESPTYDLHYYLTAILGYASSGRKGQVLKKVKTISLREYLDMDIKEITGLDFGTASPAGIIGVKTEGNKSFAHCKSYVPLDILSIGKKFSEWDYGDEDLIVADSAEPKNISKLRNGWEQSELGEDDKLKYPKLLKGFHVRSATKGPGSIESGISLMTGMELFAVEEDLDLWNEIYNYIYATNKEGEFTNTPIDDFNHLIDPWRYVLQGRGRFY